MPNKNKPAAAKTTQETWRKPLAVPPRTNAMRAFYQSSDEPPAQKIEPQTAPPAPEKAISPEPEQKTQAENPRKKTIEELLTEPLPEKAPPVKKAPATSKIAEPRRLSEADLTAYLGLETEDIFDIHEILRGKSFDIYLTLLKAADEKDRCKITQPELMKQTGIKNRRTFYKHENWLIDLKLLEKRHLQGDHQGVVYKIFKLAEVLPVPGEIVDQLAQSLKDFKPGSPSN